MSIAPIRLVLSDVDGTLVTSQKNLTERTIRAVQRLRDVGVIFAITSARPPQGLLQFVEPLDMSTPLAGFNGAMLVDKDSNVLEVKTIGLGVVAPVLDVLAAHGVGAWVFRGAEWFVSDEHGPHVEREAFICQCSPIMRAAFTGLDAGVAKIVGVSDDLDAVSAAQFEIAERFEGHVSATRSQPYYLDVTHPEANKGSVVTYLSALYGIASSGILTIGDMQNDVSMFGRSGLSIAMGNAEPAVQSAAHEVTSSNNDEGFARAVEYFVLDRPEVRFSDFE
jgi:hypothetical protein